MNPGKLSVTAGLFVFYADRTVRNYGTLKVYQAFDRELSRLLIISPSFHHLLHYFVFISYIQLGIRTFATKFVNISFGVDQPRHFLGLLFISSTIS